MAVCELERADGEGHEISVCRLSFSHTDEFAAFDGEVLVVVNPDGTIE